MFHYYLKNGLFAIIGILFAGLVLIFLLWLPEPWLLGYLVRPTQGIGLPQWLEEFQRFHGLLLPAVLLLALLWHLFALITSGRAGDDRLLWAIGAAIVGLLALAMAVFFMPPTEAGTFWCYFFAVANGVGAFWLATVLWTPAAHKYDPPGAHSLRGMTRL